MEWNTVRPARCAHVDQTNSGKIPPPTEPNRFSQSARAAEGMGPTSIIENIDFHCRLSATSARCSCFGDAGLRCWTES
ncbi:hypothetical protein BaRGS_00015005 [Batillaria attramentaria]|uniref:Uncharacterized protein n=1 Tax=Batillaria attramentaria TaxID=370345 RepID=A0ABD0L386_9CAEN